MGPSFLLEIEDTFFWWAETYHLVVTQCNPVFTFLLLMQGNLLNYGSEYVGNEL